ncbi:MAG TPA: hypothetical protein VIV60_30160 [Polyangiaceae bacterium]
MLTCTAQSRLALADEGGLISPTVFDAFDRQRDAPPNEEANYRSDGVYGRFDGEISLVPMLGTQWTQAGWLTQLGVSAYYLNTIGVAFRSSDGSWSPIKPRADVNVSSLSLALRPLFLLRWTQDLEHGPKFLDLTLDSLTLKVGSYWSQQHSADVQHVGVETEISFGLPILAKANGPWITWSVLSRWPKVTHADHPIDIALGVALEWSFSLGN